MSTSTRIETELEVKAYIQNLQYALNIGATIEFQINRRVDEKRDEHYTNTYTVQTLLLGEYGNTKTFVMSFHFAEKAFTPDMFPYKK